MEIFLNDVIRGKGVWKFNCSFLKDAVFLDDVRVRINCIINDNHDMLPNHLWEFIKYKLRQSSIIYGKQKAKQSMLYENYILTKISNYEDIFFNSPSADCMANLESAKSELHKLYDTKVQGSMIRSRARWVEYGERNTRYFLNLENRNRSFHSIDKIKDTEGNIISDCHNVLDCLKGFYSKLYSPSTIDPHVTDVYFHSLPNFPQLSNEESMSCEGVLTLDECNSALLSMPKNKSPGSDGFTVEFYSSLWPHINSHVIDSLNFGFFCGHLSHEQSRAIIKLLPKPGKDALYIGNWRPISLLNVDYKVAAKCIANRIKNVINSIIHVDQTGFIKGRYIGENIRTILDLIDHCNDNAIPAFILFLDFQKAFDSVGWYFIDKSLAAFNFGDDLRRWIKVLYSNSTACILNNGISTGFFDIRKGVRQGCPLSPYLFIICVEFLAIKLRDNSDFQGISINNFEFKLTQYADDTTIFLDNNFDSLNTVLTMLNDFCSASGLKINMSKSMLFPLGPAQDNVTDDFIQCGIDITYGPVKALGINFTSQKADLYSLNYLPKLSRLKTQLNIWAARDLTPIGKITIIKCFGISQLVFLLNVLPNPPDHFIKEVNHVLYKFIWSNKPDKIKRDTLSLSYSDGGLNMVNLNYFKHALKISWVKRYLTGPPKAWKILFNNALKKFGGDLIFRCNFSINDIASIKNDFVKDICIAWSDLTYRNCSNTIPCNVILWNNSNIRINDRTLFIKSMYNSGIVYMHDIVSSDGLFLSFQEIKGKFNISNVFFTTYFGIVKAIPIAWRRTITQTGYVIHQDVFLNKILGSLKVTKIVYNDFINAKTMSAVLPSRKWNSMFDTNLPDDFWTKACKTTFNSVRDTKIIYFQFKYLHHILATNLFLYKIKVRDNPLCSFCNDYIENYEHLFWNCQFVKTFWVRVTVDFCPTNILSFQTISFGLNNAEDISINSVIIHAKHYIYSCKMNNSYPCIKDFKSKMSYR